MNPAACLLGSEGERRHGSYRAETTMSRRDTAKESLWYSLQLTWTLLLALAELTFTVLEQFQRLGRYVERKVWFLTYRAGVGIAAVGMLVAAYLSVTGGPTEKDKERLTNLKDGNLDDAIDFQVDRETVESGFETAADSAQSAFSKARERGPSWDGEDSEHSDDYLDYIDDSNEEVEIDVEEPEAEADAEADDD